MQTSESVVGLQYGGFDLNIALKLREQGDDLLVLLHGLGCAKESFDGAFSAPELAGYAVCALDFPGHGGSTRHLPRGFYSLEACADIAGEVVRQVLGRAQRGYNRVCVAGHSLGGAVAVLLPESEYEIASLVSIDGNLIGEDCGLVSRGIAKQTLGQFVGGGYGELCAALRGSSGPDTRAWALWCASAAPDAMHATARSLVEWSETGKLLEQFNAAKERAFLYGERDDRTYLLPLIADSVVAAVPDAGHFMMVDNPQGFYKLLAAALEPDNSGSAADFGGQYSLQPVPQEVRSDQFEVA